MPKIEIIEREKEIPIADIDPAPWNVREPDIDRESLVELIESIRENGLLQPVVVYKAKEDGRYKVIIGQRRFEAKKVIDPEGTIPARVIEETKREIMIAWSLTENIQRRDLKRGEIVKAIEYFYKKYKGNVKKIAAELGVHPVTVYDYLNITKDAPPEAVKLLKEGKLAKEDLRRAVTAGGGDAQKTVAIAKVITTLQSPEKRRLLDEAEQNPKLKARDLLSRAKRTREEIRLTIYLPLRVNDALDKVSKEIGLVRSELALDIIKDWLKIKGYL